MEGQEAFMSDAIRKAFRALMELLRESEKRLIEKRFLDAEYRSGAIP